MDKESITEKGTERQVFIGPNHAYKHDHQPNWYLDKHQLNVTSGLLIKIKMDI